jgi:hypothetical protein
LKQIKNTIKKKLINICEVYNHFIELSIIILRFNWSLEVNE